MDKLVLHPTETSQWQALVNEAQATRNLQLHEELESYLVFLLMRYSSQPKMISSILAFDYLESAQAMGTQRQGLLRDVGDKSLLFTGLFPGLAQKRHVKLSYFVDLGQSAYATLSTLENQSVSDLFASLCEEFIMLVNVLQAMRKMTDKSPLMSQLSLTKLWHETGDQRILDILQQTIPNQSFFIPNDHDDIEH